MSDRTPISPDNTLTSPIDETDHLRGQPDAPVTLVEYGDYECPHCGRAYPIVKSIQEEMGDDFRFVFRNFPLKQAHPHALHAAEAAEAAGVQGKFWAMHDHLYEHQDALEDDDLRQYAEELELDTTQFERDVFDENRFEQRILHDFKGGIHGGVNGTPTFFIDGARYDGPLEEASLAKALRDSMERNEPR